MDIIPDERLIRTTYLLTQKRKEEITDMTNETTMKAAKAENVMAGIINILDWKPGYVNATIEKPLTKVVATYKVITPETHLKRPKVTKLKGKSNKLIKGLSNESASVKARAPRAKY